MAMLILILFLVAIVCFIYESILLPSIRLNIRFKIFSVRDKLRLLMVENPDIDNTAFEYNQESINMLLAYLHRYDIMSVVEAERIFKKNESLQNKLKKRNDVLDNCSVKELQAIREEYISLAVLAMAANSLFFLLLFLPFFLLCKGTKYCKNKLKNITSEIFSTPEGNSDFLDRICIS